MLLTFQVFFSSLFHSVLSMGMQQDSEICSRGISALTSQNLEIETGYSHVVGCCFLECTCQAEHLVQTMLLGIPASHVVVLQFESWIGFQFQLLEYVYPRRWHVKTHVVGPLQALMEFPAPCFNLALLQLS